MPYTTDTDIRDAIAGALGLASGSELPTHWTARIVTTGNNRGYYKLREVLLGRGFTVAQIAAWEGAANWNERLGVLYTMLEARKSGAQIGGDLDTELQAALEELKTVTLVIDDEPVYPTLASGRIGRGERSTARDRYTLDTPDGTGDFSPPEDTTRL